MALAVLISLACLCLSLLVACGRYSGFAVAQPLEINPIRSGSCKINNFSDIVSQESQDLVLLNNPIWSDLIGTDYIAHVRAATLPSGCTYRYVYYPNLTGRPTILFLHGLPSSSHDWRHQFAYFAGRGYGIVAPYLLGYGGSDKPSDPAEYTLKKQAAEMIDLVECVGAEKLVSVGHDL